MNDCNNTLPIESRLFIIQEAIDDAPPGGTVNVPPGIYSEQLVINKPLTLTGPDPDVGQAVIDASGMPPAPTIHILSSEVTITLLTIENGLQSGIQIGSAFLQNLTDIVITGNSITGNAVYGLKNETAYTVDAINNWWGSANGPEHVSNTYNVHSQGDRVSDNATFTPWLNAPNGISFAPITINSAGFSSIKAALDAVAAGDSILVSAGTFTEPLLTIGKPLSIQGTDYRDAGGNHVTQTSVRTNSPRAAIAIVSNTADVHISWLTFDRHETAQIALYFDKFNDFNNSSISDCRVHGDLGPIGGTNLFAALLALNGAQNIVFQRNTVEGFHPGLYGAGIGFIFAYGITIRDNAVDGLGVAGNGLMAMIYGQGSSIVGNSVTGAANGIYLNQASVVIENNVLHGNEIGITAWPGGWITTIRENNIYDNQIGIQASAEGISINYNNIYDNTDYGVLNPTDRTLDATYNWWGDNSGPYHPTENPGGTGNPVSDYVDFVPWLGQDAPVCHDICVPVARLLSSREITHTIPMPGLGCRGWSIPSATVTADCEGVTVKFAEATLSEDCYGVENTIGLEILVRIAHSESETQLAVRSNVRFTDHIFYTFPDGEELTGEALKEELQRIDGCCQTIIIGRCTLEGDENPHLEIELRVIDKLWKYENLLVSAVCNTCPPVLQKMRPGKAKRLP